MNIDLIKIAVALFCGLLIGFEREQADKTAGLRTFMLIVLGATLITIFTLSFLEVDKVSFDAIRAIAYYVLAIGFVGGGIIRKATKSDGITTATLLLPMCVVGFLCGIEKFALAITATCIIFLILMLKHVQIKLKDLKKKRKKRRSK